MVADIASLPDQTPTIVHVTDIDKLKELATPDISAADVAMRLFFVEDITAPVVEVLGAAFDCHPLLFAEHMYTVGRRDPHMIKQNGLPDELNHLYSELRPTHKGKPFLPTERDALPFFSLPFRRFFRYGPGNYIEFVSHNSERTMHRDYNNVFKLLEERVTGTVCSKETSEVQIGQ
jgi:hypothetical protein